LLAWILFPLVWTVGRASLISPVVEIGLMTLTDMVRQLLLLFLVVNLSYFCLFSSGCQVRCFSEFVHLPIRWHRTSRVG
jgi:hypothetical protein